MATFDGPENGEKKPDASGVYGALVQLAVHGQENKWWMLYIFLTFNSLLLVSCATLFAAKSGIQANILLSVFSAAGIFIDFCWFRMAVDYAAASNLYGDKVVDAEKLLPEGLPLPLTERKAQRASKSRFGTSEFVATALPKVLVALYVFVVVLAWLRD